MRAITPAPSSAGPSNFCSPQPKQQWMGDKDGWKFSDWYREGEDQLHFFPRQKRLIFTTGRRIRLEAEAWGGTSPASGYRDPVMQPRPTTPGHYVIYDHGPYVTPKWKTSRIAWGTPLKLDPGGGHVLYEAGSGSNRWKRVDRVIPEATVEAIKGTYAHLYGPSVVIHDSNGDGIPDKWVFNDFGPWAIRYHRDPNRNRRLDPGEELMGEMIHTTPENEAATVREARGENRMLTMVPSHGCIHIKPIDRVKFLKLGAFRKGNLMIVHDPSEPIPDFSNP